MTEHANKSEIASAYNDWAVEYCSYDPNRVLPLGLITLENIDAAAKELTRIGKKGIKGAMIWAEAPDNIAFFWSKGAHEAVEAALAAAAHVTRLDYSISRVAASPLEPRVTLAQPEQDGRMLVHSSTQNPYQLRDALAQLIGKGREWKRSALLAAVGAFNLRH